MNENTSKKLLFGLSSCNIIMKKLLFILVVTLGLLMANSDAGAQCSICNKTVMQMGKKPAEGFNTGIIYLMIIPYAAIGVIGYKWWKSDREKF